MPVVLYSDLGLISYKTCWDHQEHLFNGIVSAKIKNRNLPAGQSCPINNYLLFCEHPHVYTLGKNGSAEHLLLNEKDLGSKQASFYKINRGGDITYHGPGQIVGYPILDLEQFFTDIHRYMRSLEEAIILTLADFGIPADRINGLTGVWLDPDDPAKARKICAMGVRCSRWVTMHGFAFNVSPDLNYFGNIIPCGISDKAVTSMEKELGHKPDTKAVKLSLKTHIASVFRMQLIPADSNISIAERT